MQLARIQGYLFLQLLVWGIEAIFTSIQTNKPQLNSKNQQLTMRYILLLHENTEGEV